MLLFLLRHAESPPSPAGDKDRVLSDHGKAQARKIGLTMSYKRYFPDFVLCSPAMRTRQTLDGLLETFEELPTDFQEPLYYSGTDELLGAVQAVPSSVKSLLIVSHNPSIHQLASILTGDGPEDKIRMLMMGYPPATLTVLDCPVESWEEIQPQGNKLTDLIMPD